MHWDLLLHSPCFIYLCLIQWTFFLVSSVVVSYLWSLYAPLSSPSMSLVPNQPSKASSWFSWWSSCEKRILPLHFFQMLLIGDHLVDGTLADNVQSLLIQFKGKDTPTKPTPVVLGIYFRTHFKKVTDSSQKVPSLSLQVKLCLICSNISSLHRHKSSASHS